MLTLRVILHVVSRIKLLPSSSSLPISHLSLQDPASEAEVDKRTGSSQTQLPDDILDADSPSILSPILAHLFHACSKKQQLL